MTVAEMILALRVMHPDAPVCVTISGVLHEISAISSRPHATYLPADGIVARDRVVIVEVVDAIRDLPGQRG